MNSGLSQYLSTKLSHICKVCYSDFYNAYLYLYENESEYPGTIFYLKELEGEDTEEGRSYIRREKLHQKGEVTSEGRSYIRREKLHKKGEVT